MSTRKKKRKKDAPAYPLCERCEEPSVFGHDLCPTCLAAESLVGLMNASFKKGNIASGLLSAVGGVALQAGKPMIQKFVGEMSSAAQAQGQPQQQPAQRKPEMNPWPILGLDAATATSSDVKRVQRQLADIYHPDKKNTAVSEDMLTRVNAAATVALK